MNYTLYIDESGDFETSKGRWVLAGLLIADGYENSENMLNKRFSSLPKKLGLRSIKEFHLNVLRSKFLPEKAVGMAKEVITRLEHLKVSYKGIACINDSQISMSDREKNYRLMLSDILAVCETAVRENEKISKLDLVVASRTIDGVRQTTISDVHSDVLRSLPLSLEVDLATKGMIDLIGRNIEVHIVQAQKSWGLVSADFLANLSYNGRGKFDKAYLKELTESSFLATFQSWGGFEVRRAHVAERNKDYALSLFRWIILICSGTNEPIDGVIQRILNLVFTTQGSTGYKITIEALLEKLWRNSNQFSALEGLVENLDLLEGELKEYFKNNIKFESLSILFRLRNLKMTALNHLGRSADAFYVIKEQEPLVARLVSDPENFQLILNFKVAETEVFVNSLELHKALELSEDYSSVIENLKNVWQLLLDDDQIDDGFYKSNMYIKSEMSLIRVLILNMGLNNSLSADLIEERILKLRKNIEKQSDLDRYMNYQMMFLIKKLAPEKAIELFCENISNDNEVIHNLFDVFWFIRSVNDSFLLSRSINFNVVESTIEKLLDNIDLAVSGHPTDLILREISLFEFNRGNFSEAKKYIRKSKKASKLGESEISIFLEEVLRVHDDFINTKLGSAKNYFNNLGNHDLVKSMCDPTLETPLLVRVRQFSPY